MISSGEITFVILTWNSEEYIGGCLDSIASFTHIPSRVIIVDNGSTDATIEIAEAHLPACNSLLLKQDKNLGTTVSRNIAFAEIGESPYVCVLDSDTIVNEAAFLTMLNVLKNDESVGIVGPTMRNAAGIEQLSGRNLPSLGIKIRKAIPIKGFQARGAKLEQPDTPILDGLQNVPYLLSACWLMKTSLLCEVGMLDENIFYAPEDVDYCVRVWEAGYRVVRCWNANIIHEYQRISKKKLLSKMNLEHVKGLIYYFIKHGYLFKQKNVLNI